MQIYFIQDMNAYTVTALLYDTSMACAKYISDIQPAREKNKRLGTGSHFFSKVAHRDFVGTGSHFYQIKL